MINRGRVRVHAEENGVGLVSQPSGDAGKKYRLQVADPTGRGSPSMEAARRQRPAPVNPHPSGDRTAEKTEPLGVAHSEFGVVEQLSGQKSRGRRA
jgi:hypothetical protein